MGRGAGQHGADSSKGTLEVLSRKRIQTIASNKNLSHANNQSLTSAQGSRPRLLSLYSGKYYTQRREALQAARKREVDPR